MFFCRTQRTLESAGTFDEPIDIAFLPFWYFTHPVGQRLLESRLRSARLFALHVPRAQQAKIKAAVATSFPGATPLLRAMAQYSIE
ncbi:MAG: hypothetical protein IH969_06205 [Candidatus Krumholzibacteriota bacterium]|nr:hypothetical protein [Candidatus Krumholzibacteriota bacterium]